MINALRGIIYEEDCGPGYITLWVTGGGVVTGIGYKVFVMNRTNIGAGEHKFYIHENISAAAQGPSKYDLYGFETKAERKLFRALVKHVDRCGCSMAMKVMNIAPPDQILQAIRLGSQAYLERGCGESTSANIILVAKKIVADAGRDEE